ncbi:MAG: alpha/beta fold hydrolase [Thiomonas sp.]
MLETTMTFGPRGDLLGTVSFPANGSASIPRFGVLLFNAGVIHRVGSHRLNVKLARALAADGIATLRFDLHGMGDSMRADGRLSYKEQVVADLGAGMDLLQNITGARHFALVGFCSGALPSYWCAQADARVSAIVLYDALSFATLRSRLRYVGVRLMHHGIGPKAWARWTRAVMRGLTETAALARQRLRHSSLSALLDGRGADSDMDERIDPHALGQSLLALAQRGTGVMVLSAGTDYSAVNYAGQLRETLGLRHTVHDRLLFAHLADIDHAVTTRAAQQQWIDTVRRGLLQLTPVQEAAP